MSELSNVQRRQFSADRSLEECIDRRDYGSDFDIRTRLQEKRLRRDLPRAGGSRPTERLPLVRSSGLAPDPNRIAGTRSARFSVGLPRESKVSDTVAVHTLEHATSNRPGERSMNPRRAISWRRFRLSTAFIAVTMIGMWLAVEFHREPLTKDNLSRLQQRQRIDLDVVRVVWNATGDRVAFVGWEKSVEIRDSVTMWKLSTIGENKKIIDFAFSPDENVVAYCENGTSAEIHDLRTREVTVIEAINPQPDVVFSPDGKLLATGGYGDTARLWDVQTGKLRFELNVGPTVGGLRPVFSAQGGLLAIGNRNSTTHIFDVETGEQVQILPRRSSQELMFHPNGATIAVAYVDAKIGLWDVKSGELLRLADTTAEEIYALDWSPDGHFLASAGLQGDINLWNGSDLRPIRTLPAPEWVISVRFRPDMRGIVTAGGSRMSGGQRFVQEWEVPSFVKSTLRKNVIDP